MHTERISSQHIGRELRCWFFCGPPKPHPVMYVALGLATLALILVVVFLVYYFCKNKGVKKGVSETNNLGKEMEHIGVGVPVMQMQQDDENYVPRVLSPDTIGAEGH